METKCDWCGATVHKRPRDFVVLNHHFCNRECHREWRKENPGHRNGSYSIARRKIEKLAEMRKEKLLNKQKPL